MALQKKLDLSTDQVFALGQGEGKIMEIKGYYLGRRTVAVNGNDSAIHVFQTTKGNVGVWGTSKLNGNLTNDDLGVYQEIFYKGKVKLQGGKTQHTYDFNSDPEDTISVPKLTTGAGNTQVEVTDYENDIDDTDNAPYVAAANDRAAQVSALINKNKR